MGIIDILLMVLIAGGAFYLLYRSIWKNKGHCVGSGCCSDMCKTDESSDCHTDGKES